MDAIEEDIKKKKVKYVRIDGSTPHTRRHEYVKMFQDPSE